MVRMTMKATQSHASSAGAMNICWCDLNQGPRSHSKCLSARISERILSIVSALKSWRQGKYNDGMKGQCNSHLATTWSSAQEDMVSFPVVFTTMP